MAQKKSPNSKKSGTPDEKAVRALLELAAQDGWHAVTMDKIAARSKIAPADLKVRFRGLVDLLAAYSAMIDTRVVASAGGEGSPRDRLFDLMMERFDALNDARDSMIAILRGLKRDQKNAARFLPHLCRSMARMLEAAEIATAGPCGSLRVAGLLAVYLETLRHWADDASEDMSPTMAALDKNLGRAEYWAETIRL